MRDSLRKICCLAPLLAAVVLVVVLYFLRYDTVGTEDALVQAASEYTGKELEAIILKVIPGADGTCDGKGDLVLLCRSTGAEESSSPENSSDKKNSSDESWNGIVLFERGINGRYVPVESTLYDYSVPVHDVSLKDESMGFFGGGDGSEAVTVFFSCRYPEKDGARRNHLLRQRCLSGGRPHRALHGGHRNRRHAIYGDRAGILSSF